MTLVKCHPREARIVAAEPVIEVVRDVLYVPASDRWIEQGWGLYDHEGRPVDAAASGSGSAPPDAVAEAEAAGEHVYCGMLERETAGFLLETLSRLWSLPQAGQRLVFHAREPLSRLFEVPVIGSTLAALGFTVADCVAFERPTRLRSVSVPAPSFERDRLAFGAYGRLVATLGIRLSGSVARPACAPRAVHVSTARERVPVLQDEDTFDRLLEARGVDVVHPTAMSFASLVGRLRSAPLVSSIARGGVIDLASLACALREPAVRMVMVADDEPAMDGAILDTLCRHETLFVRGFDGGPAALAEGHLRSMRRLGALHGLALGLDDDEGGQDLGAGAVACVDSDGQDARILMSGLLTGLEQWQVGGRQYPWVQIEFPDIVAVREVRVYGPVAGENRPSSVSLFGSYDGVDWALLAERDEAGPITDPHRFLAGEKPWRGRWLRLQSGTGVLALDRIEIFGPKGEQANAADAG